MDFWETRAGYKFTEHTIPALVRAVDSLTKELAQTNALALNAQKNDVNKEFAYLLQFAKQSEDFDTSMVARRQLRALWTSFCIHANYDADTAAYDSHLKQLWEAVISQRDIAGSEDEFDDLDAFNMFMTEDLV